MAHYRFSANKHNRGLGYSAVAAAAYRAGDSLVDERSGEVHDYSRKHGCDYSEIISPINMTRTELWNEQEKVANRKNSIVCRDVTVSLPLELSISQRRDLARELALEIIKRHEVAVDIAFHEENGHNPHAHLLLTNNRVTKDGFGKVSRSLDKTSSRHDGGECLTDWGRPYWADIQNAAFEREGLDVRVSHLSLEEQGVDREPQIHVGVAANAMAKRGIYTERYERNEQIKHLNQLSEELAQLDLEIEYQQVVGSENIDRVEAVLDQDYEQYWSQQDSNDVADEFDPFDGVDVQAITESPDMCEAEPEPEALIYFGNNQSTESYTPLLKQRFKKSLMERHYESEVCKEIEPLIHQVNNDFLPDWFELVMRKKGRVIDRSDVIEVTKSNDPQEEAIAAIAMAQAKGWFAISVTGDNEELNRAIIEKAIEQNMTVRVNGEVHTRQSYYKPQQQNLNKTDYGRLDIESNDDSDDDTPTPPRWPSPG